MGRFDNGSLATFESTRYARGHKALYTFEINGETRLDLLGLARSAPSAILRPPRRRASSAAGARSTSRDGDHPYMGNWWVPGLQIGYEHSFVHQVADFLKGLETGKPASRTSATPADAARSRRGSGIGEGSEMGYS